VPSSPTGWTVWATLSSASASVSASSAAASVSAPLSLLTQKRTPQGAGAGLYPAACDFNHSCDPTAEFYNQGGELLVRTLREVRPGEPLTVSYVPVVDGRRSRREALAAQFHFHCCCDRCVREEDEEAGEVATDQREHVDGANRSSSKLGESRMQSWCVTQIQRGV
jgi:hypothetical protein